MICFISSPDERKKIARIVLEDLTDWFEVVENREKYIEDSAGWPFWAAIENDEPAGFLCLNQTGNATVELAVMGVCRKYHRNGLGRQLFEAAKEYAVKEGFSFMQVKTVRTGMYEDYDKTNEFYKGVGFKELEVIFCHFNQWMMISKPDVYQVSIVLLRLFDIRIDKVREFI
jgi:GNAT superfamily N-acetyltransferase